MTVSNTPDVAGPVRVSPGQVELILSQIESLPTLPAIAGRLLEMTTGDRFGTGEIAALVESDQSLSARVLSLVRKSNVGSDVQTVDRAVVLLGADVVRSVVLGVQIFDAFRQSPDQAASRFDRTGFWRHSLAVACAARLLAEKRVAGGKGRQKGVWPEEAFVCGLLHDLGKVLFDSCFPKSYDRVIEKVESRRGDIADIEREVFGVDHAIAGQRLAAHWKLPQPIAECMWLHHHSPASTPTRIGYPDHVLLIQAADRLVRQMHIGYSGNHGTEDLGTHFCDAIGLSPQAIEQVMLALPDAIEARAEILGLHDISSREVLHETMVRTNSELARVNTALTLANRDLEQRSRTLDAICALNRTLGDDHRHESVAQAVAQGIRMLAPASALAVVVSSPARHLTIVVGLSADDPATRTDVFPTLVSEDAPAAGERGVEAQVWLPGPVMDRLGVLLGETPQYCRRVPCSGGLAAALVLAEKVGDDLDRSLERIGEWAAPWFKAAESTVIGQQLAGELAEINRQLVKSQAELARMRSLAMVGEMAAGGGPRTQQPPCGHLRPCPDSVTIRAGRSGRPVR
jgi:HD-like signal output (HDOD) protein